MFSLFSLSVAMADNASGSLQSGGYNYYSSYIYLCVYYTLRCLHALFYLGHGPLNSQGGDTSLTHNSPNKHRGLMEVQAGLHRFEHLTDSPTLMNRGILMLSTRLEFLES